MSFDAGGKGGSDGGKAKKGGFLDGLRSFGVDFANAFARNMGASTEQRSTKPSVDRRDPVAVRDRPIAARQIQRRLKIERKAADEEAGKQDAVPQAAEEQLEEEGTGAAAQDRGSASDEGDEASVGAEAGGQDAVAPNSGSAAEATDKDGDEEQGAETSEEEAKPSMSVAAKLKGVHRKVFRTPQQAPAAAAPAADEATTPVDTAGAMDGESHTLTVDPTKGEVTLASVKMNARAKVQAGLSKMEAGDQTPDAVKDAKARLNAINAKIEALEQKIQGGKKAKKSELMSLSQEIMDAVSEFGSKFKVKDLHDPLSGFPAPTVQAHPVPTGGARPDGTTPESHHVPNNELFQALLREMEEVGKEIKKKGESKPKMYRDVGQEILDKVDDLRSKVGAGGKGLAAILLHRITHQNIEGKKGTAVHSAPMAAVIMGMLVKQEDESGIELEKIMNGCCDGVCVKPVGVNWDAFLDRIKAEIADAETKRNITKKQKLMERVATAEEEETKISKKDKAAVAAAANQKIVPTIKDAYEAGYEQMFTAVTAALGLSLVDGTEGAKNGALGSLAGLAASTWACITDVSFTA